jgi:hypothetical protein
VFILSLLFLLLREGEQTIAIVQTRRYLKSLTIINSRTGTQKPADDLYESFKKSYPAVRSASDSISPESGATTAESADGAPALVDFQADLSRETTAKNPFHASDSHFMPGHDQMAHLEPLNLFSPLKLDDHDKDRTPRAHGEGWRFTPSIMDTAYASFTHHLPSYYTPTPGGINTIYHHSAGDLHTPRFGTGLGTPLSMPTTDSSMHTIPAAEMHELPPTMNPHEFHNFQSFDPQRGFAPADFGQHTAYNPTEEAISEQIDNHHQIDTEMSGETDVVGFTPTQLSHTSSAALQPVHK